MLQATSRTSLILALLATSAAGCGDNLRSLPDGGGTPDAAEPPLPPDAPPPDAPPLTGPAAGAWLDGFLVPGLSGTIARVEAVVRGPDNRIYVGGIFADAAGTPVDNVAVWDGIQWRALGAAPGAWVRDLAFDERDVLWAAGGPHNGQHARLARWNGGEWLAAPVVTGEITGIAAVADGIAAVGPFTVAAGPESVALFDGTDWRAIGSGAIDGQATAVTATADGLCVAGALAMIGGVPVENAACWNGTAWSPLGRGLPAGVEVLARAPDGRWYAGGTLTFLLDDGGFRAGIAVLGDDGVWVPFEGGINVGAINNVRAIAFHGRDVIVTGNFGTAGEGARTVAAINAARWSPATGWSEIGGGLRNDLGYHSPAALGGYGLVADADGGLWIGGLFSRVGETPAVSLVYVSPFLGMPTALVGTHPLRGLGGFVDALALGADGLVAAGGFRFAGQELMASVARFDGAAWHALADGTITGIVRDVLVRRDGTLAIAGELGYQDRAIAFAQWDGTAWQPIGPVRGTGFAMHEDADGRLWLAGELASVGGVALANLARLDGTTWVAAGTFDGRVNALAEHGGTMFAGGLFRAADHTPAFGLAALGPDGWREHGGVDALGYVGVLESSPALGLVVGGSFATIAGEPIPGLAAWDGQIWRSLGALDGDFGPAFVASLAAYGDGLFVSGGFRHAGGVAADRIAWFDGSAWHALGAGLDDHAEALVVDGGTLWVGGPFTAAGGRPSAGVAAWAFPP